MQEQARAELAETQRQGIVCIIEDIRRFDHLLQSDLEAEALCMNESSKLHECLDEIAGSMQSDVSLIKSLIRNIGCEEAKRRCRLERQLSNEQQKCQNLIQALTDSNISAKESFDECLQLRELVEQLWKEKGSLEEQVNHRPNISSCELF